MQLDTAGTVNITGGGTLTAGAGSHFGYLLSDVKVTLGTLDGVDPDDSSLTVATCDLANWGGAKATVELNNQTSFVCKGLVLMAAGGFATINLHDGATFSAAEIAGAGWNGTIDITLNDTAMLSTTGNFNISPSNWAAPGGYTKITVNGGTCSVGGSLIVGDATPVTLSVNRSGTFETKSIQFGAHTVGTINFDGGTLRALENDASLIGVDSTATCNVMLQSNGVIVDTNGKNVSVQASLQEDVSSPGGGLTKISDGILTLEVSPTYQGNTTINAGGLSVPNLNTPNASVYVATAATLTASSIVADTLTIGGAPIQIGAAASSSPHAVPEPGTFLLLIAFGLGCALWKIRQK
jgi:autotransporter-associated beta strand protein